MTYNKNTVNPEKRMQDQPEYVSLKAAKQRCYYKGSSVYSYYGGRGIRVCERWLQRGGLWNMIDDIGLKPTPQHTLERRDINGDYSPENCYWATRGEQARNRRVRSDNTVGVSGINYDKVHDRWVFRKMENGVRRYVAASKNKDELVELAKAYIIDKETQKYEKRH